jgi:ATP-dependent DNA helicase RecG
VSEGGRRLRQLQSIPVSELRTVGAKRSAALGAIGIESVLDLLTNYPRRYVDWTHRVDVADLAVGDQAVVLAEVCSARGRALRGRGRRSLVELTVDDGTGLLRVVFFNQPWRQRQLARGARALFGGKVDTFRGSRQMTNPVVDLLEAVDEDGKGPRTGRVIPVYRASDKAGLSSWELGRAVAEALDRAGQLADPLEAGWRDKLGLVDRTPAMRAIHHPEAMEQVGPARRRLAFDELLRLQMAVVLRRRALERDARGIPHAVSTGELDAVRQPPPGGGGTLVGRFVSGLPFTLTPAQLGALETIFADLAGSRPMHRLLQGDVGSGKTVVAVASLLAAIQGGYQAALMVPTEVLAEQHHSVVRALTAGLSIPDPARLGGERPLTVELLTNRTPAARRRRLRDGLAEGSVELVVGTHALLTEDVGFKALGLAVIDEQHRFGVEQRAALRDKGRGATGQPDLLVMTATPIPRTAAMVVFGDLDMTEINELPAGRRPVVTAWARSPLEESAAWERVRSEVAAGHRAYVICPLVEGSERVQARSAVEERERLAQDVLAEIPLGLLHGQLTPSDKEAAMAAFRDGSTPVLVATTVIEVGVDVPEATVMVILDADRFGIAQLHQLRGRVGRSDAESWCFLLAHAPSDEAVKRLQAVEANNDGFELAEVDLELRGEGTLFGTHQKGRSDLRLAQLRRDRALLADARRVADEVVAADPELADHSLLEEEVRMVLEEDEEEFLFKS